MTFVSAGVIGWPVAHSKSPLIHRFWLDAVGIDGDYGRFAVHPDRLGEALRALPSLGLAGVNITVPHKVAALEFADVVNDLDREVGAINTVVVHDDRLRGFNTDREGFLEPLLTLTERPRTAIVIGAGGAARAVLVALRQLDVSVTLVNRDRARMEALADALAAEVRDIVELRSGLPLPPADLVVNATSLGMSGQPALNVTLDGLAADTVVYDLVYAPLETPLLAAARARGMRTIDGLSMLIGQAAEAFRLFTGADPPRERDAELRALLTR